jgi:hypothetical protein
VDHLLAGVHPCVRPTGTGHYYSLTCNFRERLFDMILNAIAMGLGLPTIEVGTVIGQDKCKTRHIKGWESNEKRGSKLPRLINPGWV